jgi:lysozyme family protein
VAHKLLGFKSRYQSVAKETGVPLALLAVLHERESDADFRTNLAQGDPLTRPSTHVPAGRPVLKSGMSFPVSWEYAAVDAVKYDHLNENSAPWSLTYALWKGEAWNGFGPRNHGIHTGYLWAGTNIYTRGKYVADGVWNANAEDKQLGIVPVMLRVIQLDPWLAFGAGRAVVPDPSIVPVPAPVPVPLGVGGGQFDARAVQHALNMLGFGPLLEDGSYGRFTRNAVLAFQRKHGLVADGLVGPATGAKLSYELFRMAGVSAPAA